MYVGDPSMYFGESSPMTNMRFENPYVRASIVDYLHFARFNNLNDQFEQRRRKYGKI